MPKCSICGKEARRVYASETGNRCDDCIHNIVYADYCSTKVIDDIFELQEEMLQNYLEKEKRKPKFADKRYY